MLVVAVGAALLVHSRSGDGVPAAERGPLTAAQYDTALRLARSELAKDHATVSRAVATIVAGTVDQPNLAKGCTSGHLLVVTLVGAPADFPNTDLGGPEDAPKGPDMWISLQADPDTGVACLLGVGVGHFKAPVPAADLSPSL